VWRGSHRFGLWSLCHSDGYLNRFVVYRGAGIFGDELAGGWHSISVSGPGLSF
jgi:hypothetical protein